MLTNNYAAIVAAICATALSITSLRAEEKEEKVEFSSLPEKAQKTIQDHAEGGKIIRVEKETDGSKIAYEAKIEAKGRKREVVVDAEGNLESVEIVIQPSEAPEAVRKEMEGAAKYAGGKVDRVERVAKGSEVTYEVLIVGKDKRQEVVISSEGKVLKREDKEKKEKKD
jgi:uncharacterized membrane protein YkoI